METKSFQPQARAFFRTGILLSVWFSLLGLSLNGAHADPSRTPASYHDDHFQAITSGRQLSQKDVIFQSLLSTEGKDMAWPAFPRTWHEETVADFVASNTALGLNVAGVSGGVAIDFKFALKSSVVLIASNRSIQSIQDGNREVAPVPIDDPLQFEIFRWDPVTNRTLPNVRPGFPIVGLCAFEASLNYAISAKGGIQFLGMGQTVEGGRVRTISHTLFSRFFQVDGQSSAMQLLDQVCNTKFRSEVESYVIRDFSRNVVELFAYTDPNNECQADPKDGPNGDVQCLSWHSRNFDSAIQHITTPRCVLTHSGIHRCQVVAKLDGNCPMYWDPAKSKAISSEETAVGAHYQKATNSVLEFPCDTKQGLTCKIISEPYTVLNVPWWMGSARCAKK